MKRLDKESYEAPATEILVVKMENNLLESLNASRGEDTYGKAIEYEWD